MNPLAALKQGIVDHVRSAAFITLEELRAVFHREASAQEFTEAYNDLMRIKQLTTVQQSDGTTQVLPYVQKANIEDLMFKTLSESSNGANQIIQTFLATSATATPTPSAILSQPEVILLLVI